MNRRDFIASAACAVGAGASARPTREWNQAPALAGQETSSIRSMFPRLQNEVYLNAAAGTPLSRFAEEGVTRYLDFWRLGPGEGRIDYVRQMLDNVRSAFAKLVGAGPAEIGLVPCTKAGEQIVLNSLPALRTGANVVTNDLHFAGCLHNLEGLRRKGLDVRIVRHADWRVAAEAMAEVMDQDTALVSVTLVSNVNGHIEPIRELADLAHERGAILYADIIQAAGIVPLDVHSMGIDVAACSGYKWLFGPHGTGFLYVREEHQGRTLPDLLVPGAAKHNYSPWVIEPEPGEPLLLRPRTDARRYEPGHHSYLGYCALFEGLKFINDHGVDALLAHSTGLAQRLIEAIDPHRYPCISPHPNRSPIVTFSVHDPKKVRESLRRAGIAVSFSQARMRVSPAIYNTVADIDHLAEALDRT